MGLAIDESVTYKLYRWMPKSNVHALPRKPPRPWELLRIIRRLAEAGCITYSVHAEQERMPERGIDFFDVEGVLRNGEIDGEITPGRRAGEWKCLVVGRAELDARDMGVATVVVRKQRLIIKTVEWIDP